MNKITTFRLPHLLIFLLLLSLSIPSVNCSKSSSSSTTDSTGTGSKGSLLSKEVLVAADGSGATVDSIVSNFQYDGKGNLTGLQQSNNVSVSGAVSTTGIGYTMTYSGNVITGLTGTVNESVTFMSTTYAATVQVTTSFQSSGGHVVSYVQKAVTSGSSLVPVTPETASDSVLLTYDAGGNIATLSIYQISPVSGAYELNSMESFTFSQGNLSQTVVVTYGGGVAEDTFTTSYSYDTKVSAAPVWVVPGVAIINANNLTQTSDVETGVNPGSVTTAYTTTYNSANQPSSSKAIVTTTPANTGEIATENITYTY
jgi:hypothetical protein